jgi:hypothetical protein
MRFIFLTILTAILVVFLNPVTVYWIVMICIALLSAALNPTAIGSFMGAGLGMGLTWVGQCIYLEITTGSSLPAQMGELLGVGSGGTLVVITGTLGFLLGAFSGWTGVLFRRVFIEDHQGVNAG